MLPTILKLMCLALGFQRVRSLCADTQVFPSLNDTVQPEPITTNETNICDPVFASKGSCAFANATQGYWDAVRPKLQDSAANSYQLALQYVNALLFYSARNNGTSLEDYKNPKTGSFFFMTDNIFRPNNTNASAFFYEQPQAIQDIFFNHRRKLDSCFRAISVINIGAFCYLASSEASFIGLYTNETNAGGVAANATTVGGQLSDCIPMLDVYCLVWYGISVTTSITPFANPFQLPNGAISRNDCFNLQTNYACNSSVCSSNINQFVTATIRQNGATFAPTAQQITELNGIFTNTTAAEDISITPSTPSSLGYALIPSFWNGIPDYYRLGESLMLNDTTTYFNEWTGIWVSGVVSIILGVFWN